MNEFEEKDYEGARSYAKNIRTNADNIMNIFNDIDNTMNSLYKDYWLSAGAEQSRSRYSEIRRKYEEFYETVKKMQEHIEKITARNEEADTEATSVVTGGI